MDTQQEQPEDTMEQPTAALTRQKERECLRRPSVVAGQVRESRLIRWPLAMHLPG